MLLELRGGVNSLQILVAFRALNNRTGLSIHFLRTEKCLLRSFGTIRCPLLKCLPMEEDCVFNRALVQVSESIANITCITQVTYKFINFTLLVNDRRFFLMHFYLSLDLITDKNGLSDFVIERSFLPIANILITE